MHIEMFFECRGKYSEITFSVIYWKINSTLAKVALAAMHVGVLEKDARILLILYPHSVNLEILFNIDLILPL